MITLILKLASEIVEAHVCLLNPAEADKVMRWILEMLRQYSAGLLLLPIAPVCKDEPFINLRRSGDTDM